VTDPEALAAQLGAEGLAGIAFVPVSFVPSASVYADRLVRGVRLVVTDREALRPVRVALAIARVLEALYPADFRPAAVQALLVHRPTLWSLLRGEPLWRIAQWADTDLLAFLQRRAVYLLYP
jgi:uncharacterized protein YbbC (DUF1343 family)